MHSYDGYSQDTHPKPEIADSMHREDALKCLTPPPPQELAEACESHRGLGGLGFRVWGLKSVFWCDNHTTYYRNSSTDFGTSVLVSLI